MSQTTKNIITVVVTVAVVATLGYFLGFAGLFAHSMLEIFYYAGLFAGAQVLAFLGLAWWNSSDTPKTIQGTTA